MRKRETEMPEVKARDVDGRKVEAMWWTMNGCDYRSPFENDEWTYLGDGVYVRPDGYGGIILHANDALRPTDRVVLEQEVLDRLINYIKVKRK
jgi:hypothetical protein